MLYKTIKREVEEVVLSDELKDVLRKHNVVKGTFGDSYRVGDDKGYLYLDKDKITLQISKCFFIYKKDDIDAMVNELNSIIETLKALGNDLMELDDENV